MTVEAKVLSQRELRDALEKFSSTLEYLNWLSAHPNERQSRHLSLRHAHTVALTDGAESTERWAVPHIARLLQETLAYREWPLLLDAGCGGGYYLHALRHDRALQIRLGVGLDVNPAALATAQARLDEVPDPPQPFGLVQGSVRQLPFAPASFGAAMCNRMLNQTGGIAEALTQVAGVLRPGGLLFIVTADSTEVSWLRQTHEEALQELGFPSKLYRPSTSPDQRLNLQNGPAWLAAHFENVTLELYQRGLSFAGASQLSEYYASGLLFQKSAAFAEPGTTPEQWLALYEKVNLTIVRQLDTTGQLTFQDGAAMFCATRRNED